MENQELTSVITVTCQTGPILDKAIASILASDSPFELVLVNNGNPPDVEEKLKALAAADQRVKLISGHGNIGFAKAANLGAKAAKGKYLLFLSQECTIPVNAITRLLAAAAKLKSHFMFGARILDEKGREKRNSRRMLPTPTAELVDLLGLGSFLPEFRLNMHKEPLPKAITEIPAISRDFMFIPAASFWVMEGFDEKYFLYYEDLDFCVRFNRFGGKTYFVPTLAVTKAEGEGKQEKEFMENNKAQGLRRYFHESFNHMYSQPILWAIDALVLARAWVRIGFYKLMLHPEVKKAVSKYHK